MDIQREVLSRWPFSLIHCHLPGCLGILTKSMLGIRFLNTEHAFQMHIYKLSSSNHMQVIWEWQAHSGHCDYGIRSTSWLGSTSTALESCVVYCPNLACMQACIPKALYVLLSCLDPITGRDANPLIDQSIRTDQNFLLEDVHAILEALRKVLELIALTQCMCHLKTSQLLHFGKQLRCSRDILKGF